MKVKHHAALKAPRFLRNLLFRRMQFVGTFTFRKDKDSYDHNVQIEGQDVGQRLGQQLSFGNPVEAVHFPLHFKRVRNLLLLLF